jgi:hypothetical protein
MCVSHTSPEAVVRNVKGGACAYTKMQAQRRGGNALLRHAMLQMLCCWAHKQGLVKGELRLSRGHNKCDRPWIVLPWVSTPLGFSSPLGSSPPGSQPHWVFTPTWVFAPLVFTPLVFIPTWVFTPWGSQPHLGFHPHLGLHPLGLHPHLGLHPLGLPPLLRFMLHLPSTPPPAPHTHTHTCSPGMGTVLEALLALWWA